MWAIIIALVYIFYKLSSLKKEVEFLKRKIAQKNFTEPNKNIQENIQENQTQKEIPIRDDLPRYIVNDKNFVERSLEEKNEDDHKTEFNFGANQLTIVGIISVLFGIGFFLNYAFENNLITKPARVILGFVSGISFVVLGDYFKNKLRNYAHYLIGGGFAILMLSAYFGIEYNIYSNTFGFGIMVLIVAMAGFLAHRLNSKILAGVSILAGFLAPFLTSTGQANEMILFNYILLLLSGMFWLVYKHGWNFLIPASLIGTGILYGGSFNSYYSNSVFWIYWIYLIIFFGIFAAAPVYSYLADKKNGLKGNLLNLIISVISGFIFVGVSYGFFERMVDGEEADWNLTMNLYPVFKNFYWVIALIPSSVYLWLAKRVLTLRDDKNLLYSILGMATFSIAMIPALQFSGKWITFSWLAEALVLGFIFYKTEIKTFLNLGLATLAIALARLFFIDSNFIVKIWNDELNTYVATYQPIFNERTFIYFVAVVSIFGFAYLAFEKAEKEIAKWLGIIGNLFILFWIYLELNSSVNASYISSDNSSLFLSIFYLLYAGLLIWIGLVKKYIGFRIFGLLLIGFVILKTYFIDVWSFGEITRILAFIILGLFVLIVGYFYSKNLDKIKEFIQAEQKK